MSLATWIHEFTAAPADALPRNVFSYVLGTSAVHQLFLLVLSGGVALLEIVPLKLQRRIVDDLGNHPWGDLVNHFRDVNVTQVNYRLLADAVDQRAPAGLADGRAPSSRGATREAKGEERMKSRTRSIGRLPGGRFADPDFRCRRGN
jgi:hypothetical protein